MITKNQVSDALGLSCVEYYYLAWIMQYYSVEKLYGQSFVLLKQIFDDFACGTKYEQYDRIPRVQDTAERYGITEHEYVILPSDRARKYIAAQGYYDLCLVRVNDAFFKNSKRRAWREDHYVAMDKKLGWINEYPLSSGTFVNEEFDRVYGGAVCCFFLKNLKAEPKDEITESLLAQDFSGINANIGLDGLENALGILRVSRKRLQRFYKNNTHVHDILAEENALLDKLYFAVRLNRIKPRKDEKTLIAEVKKLISYEKSVGEALR